MARDNDILLYSTRNVGKYVVAGRFIKALTSKIYTKLKANDCKSYLDCLNKLVDQYNNTYHHSIGKNPVDADYFVLNKKLNLIIRRLNLKLMIKSGLLNTRIFWGKATLKIGQEKYFLLILS